MKKENLSVGMLFKIVGIENLPKEEVGNIIRIEKVDNERYFYSTIIGNPPKDLNDADESECMIDCVFTQKMLTEIPEKEKEDLMAIIAKMVTKKNINYSNKCFAMLNSMKDVTIIAKSLINKKTINNDFGDYVSLSKDGFIFLPIEKELKTEADGSWSMSGRQTIKYAKLARKLLLFPENFTDAQYEDFSNRIKAYIGIHGDENGEGKYAVEIIKGEDIRKAYSIKNYTKLFSDNNNMFSSCMRGDEHQKFLDLYVNNPDVINMLVMKDHDGGIIGRALLWNYGNKKLMDRIYGNDAIIKTFQVYAETNGFYFKSRQANDSGFDMPSPLGHIEIPVSVEGLTYYPYLDTLMFYNLKKKVITNNPPSGVSYLKFRNTNGGADSHYNNGWRDDFTGAEYGNEVPNIQLSYRRHNGQRVQGRSLAQNTVEIYTGHTVLREDTSTCALSGDIFLNGDSNYMHLASELNWFSKKYITFDSNGSYTLTEDAKTLLKKRKIMKG